jgi:hypothetical protein
MARQFIVGRQHIVGGRMPYVGAEHSDVEELARYSSGAAEQQRMEGPIGMIHQPAPPQAYMRSADGPSVIEELPRHPRAFPIGFTSPTPIAAAQTGSIEVKPQVLFRGERLAVPNSLVLNFAISDVKVGKDSQLAAPGDMPSECMSNISVGVRMQLDTAEPGITITLFPKNTDTNNPHSFSSVLFGTVIE